MTLATSSTVDSIPRPVQWTRVLLTVVGASHVVVPVALWVNPDPTRNQIAADHPEFDAATISQSVDAALGAAAIFHGILAVLAIILILKLPTGRAWARRVTTISQVLSVIFSIVSWKSSPQFHAVIPLLDAAQIVLVLLLWLPGSAQRFFTPRPYPTCGS